MYLRILNQVELNIFATLLRSILSNNEIINNKMNQFFNFKILLSFFFSLRYVTWMHKNVDARRETG